MIGVPDPHWIEAVTAVVVREGRAAADRGRGASRTAASGWRRFKVPKRVMFVDALPKNPSGKLLKRELRQRYAGLYGASTPGAPRSLRPLLKRQCPALQGIAWCHSGWHLASLGRDACRHQHAGLGGM